MPPKSPVERYEQILQQDPASSVFVELAKALLEAGDSARAIEVCQVGLQHHPHSTVARVLWGKSLIQLGRPAEAMAQFDQAIGIEKDNPYAYNLIAEVLLQRGLYRSALPILRKAAGLQPNNGRVKEWLEKAQTALSGGPAPSLDEVTNPGSPLLLKSVEESEEAPPPEPPAAPASTDEGGDPFGDLGSLPDPGAPPGVRRRQPHPAAVPEGLRETGEHQTASSSDRATDEHPAMGGELPVSRRPAGASGPKLIPVLTPQPGARTSGEQLIPMLSPSEGARPTAELPALSADERRAALAEHGRGSGEKPARRTGEHPATVADGLLGDLPPPEESASAGGGLLGDLPSLEDAPPAPRPVERPAVHAAVPPPVRTSGEKRALLEELPDLLASSSSVEVPKVELSASSAQEIAQEYERELRQKLAANAEQKSFLARHGVKLAVSAVLLAAIGVGSWAFISTRVRNQGRDLRDALGDARKGISLDTAAGYRTAVEALGIAVQMDEENRESWALTAYARSLLFAEHGASAQDRAAAQEALAKPGVEEDFAAYSLVSRYSLGDGKARDGLRKAVLSSTEETPEVQELAGRILLAQRDSRAAVERFRRALELSSGNVRALVALGNYYRESGDHPTALKFYDTAAMVSEAHPERAVGAAESRLETGDGLEQALAELEELSAVEGLAPELLSRRELALGRLLTANGRAAEAVKRLSGSKGRGYEFQLALGEASMGAGDYARAEDAFESALKLRPTREEAQEALGRVLLARGRERELLGRLKDDGRRVALVRGIAYARLEDWKRARAELARTQVSGKYPTEAVIHLAVADAAEGDAARAEKVLEKALASTRTAKSDAHVALGTLYLKRGESEKARGQFELAEKDPFDYEGACALGRLYLTQGKPEKALGHLERAVQRNGSHGEARHALGRLYLSLGKLPEGLAQAEAWQQDQPASDEALLDLAWALHLNGKWKEADAASARLSRMAGSVAEAHRIRAVVLFSVGNARGAFSSLERANKLDPKDPETFCEIGHAFLRQGNPDNAEAAFGAALKNDPQNDCAGIGAALARLPSGAKAAQRLLADRAAKAERVMDRGQAWAALSRAQLVAGQVAAARKSAEEAVQVAPFLGNSHFALGLVAARQKQEETASAALRAAAGLEPAHATIRLALADALVRQGETGSAIKEYETFLRLGGDAGDEARVKKSLVDLKKKLASR
ncbi:MAG: tetratricopeptide repeat protein [Myxococcota bacterium]|nr:tetratricopeptide repeat protein [Myxococcota bacterium]